jgi:trimethylamine---corrinoid protein Co-methyltransferase
MVQLNVLSTEEIEALHQATLRVLNETGVTFTQPEGRSILLDKGAKAQGDRVFLPPDLVEEALSHCVSLVPVRGRGGKVEVLGDGSLHWHNLGGAPNIYEQSSGKRRQATIQDVVESTIVLDAMTSVTTITPMYTPQDIPGELMSLSMYRHALPFTTKPLQGPGVQTKKEVHYAVQMAAVIGEPKEVLTLGISPVSPLIFPDDVVEAIIEAARLGIAIGPLPCPTAGSTAPFSIAGAVMQQNAEVVTAVVLAQLVHPGLPMVYCGRLAMMDPRSGQVLSAVENGLASAATVHIAHRYGLPVNVYGFSTNAHTLDIQSGYERAMVALIPGLAGADELSGIGEMEVGVMSSLAQIVCDNEIAANVNRARKGFAADQNALAVDVIASAMQGSRNFLGQKHTRDFMRAGEFLLTPLAERRTWEAWEQDERRGIAERSQAEADRILREHQVPPLSESQERELDKIMAAAEKDLVNK